MKDDEVITIGILLQEEGFFSKDIKQKLKNNEILLNGEPLTSEQLKTNIISSIDAGDFIFNNLDNVRRISFLSLEEMFEADIPFVKQILTGKSLLKIAKRRWLVIELKFQ